MSKNRLIVFEGIDGAGKATQVELLAKRLRAEGRRVAVFASPRYDLPTGTFVRSALRGEFGDFVKLEPQFSALPYLLDFAAWREEIRAALKKGIVICDRYVPSTVAYHSAKLSGKKASDFVRFVENMAYVRLGLPKPDMVVYLDVPVATAKALMRHKKKDQHERNAVYQRRVASLYKVLATRKNWHSVRCVRGGKIRTEADIHAEIVRLTR